MASYTTDRPTSPSFAPFSHNPRHLDPVGADIPKIFAVPNSMTSNGITSTETENDVSNGELPSAAPVLPLASSVSTSVDPPIPDISSMNPEVQARLQEIVNGLRSNSNHTIGPNVNGNGGRLIPPTQLSPSLRPTAREDEALAHEKQRHNDTKVILANTETYVEKLAKELEERKADLEEYRVDARDLKNQIEAASIENNELRERLLDLPRMEEQLQFHLETQRALEDRLKREMGERRQEYLKWMESRLAHAKDLHSFEEERKAHADMVTHAAVQQDLIRELQQQLDGANERVVAQDRMLSIAEAEKRALQANVFDARHNMQETAAVLGEVSMAFDTQVDRLMSTLKSMELAARPSRPPLPPTPPTK